MSLPDAEQYEPRIWDLRITGPGLGDCLFNDGTAVDPVEAAALVWSDSSTVQFSVTATGAEAREVFARLAAPARETDPTGCGGRPERNE